MNEPPLSLAELWLLKGIFTAPSVSEDRVPRTVLDISPLRIRKDLRQKLLR
ncbi:major facilitator superfamily transporter, partial [Colletotrichum scovillei]